MYRTLTPLLPGVGKRIAEELMAGVRDALGGSDLSLVTPFFSSENRVWVEVNGRYFLWSIVYEMWCSEEDTYPGIGDGVLDLRAWAWGNGRRPAAIVSRVPVLMRDGLRDFSGLAKLCKTLEWCDADPRNIHQGEGTGRYPMLVPEIPGILRTATGWRATGKPLGAPLHCPEGIAHPSHYDCFGRCRCDSDATIHYPLLQQWLH